MATPEYVKITRDGLRAFAWNGERWTDALERGVATSGSDQEAFYDASTPEDADIWSFLRCACRVEEGVTVLDLFRMVEGYPRLREFLAHYSWCGPTDRFLSRSTESPEASPGAGEDYPSDTADLEYAEVFQTGHFREGQLEIDCGFHAFGPCEREPPVGSYMAGDRVAYSVSFSPPRSFAQLPLRLNERIAIDSWTERAGPLLEARRVLTLLEVLDAVYWDISWTRSGEPATP